MFPLSSKINPNFYIITLFKGYSLCIFFTRYCSKNEFFPKFQKIYSYILKNVSLSCKYPIQEEILRIFHEKIQLCEDFRFKSITILYSHKFLLLFLCHQLPKCIVSPISINLWLNHTIVHFYKFETIKYKFLLSIYSHYLALQTISKYLQHKISFHFLPNIYKYPKKITYSKQIATYLLALLSNLKIKLNLNFFINYLSGGRFKIIEILSLINFNFLIFTLKANICIFRFNTLIIKIFIDIIF